MTPDDIIGCFLFGLTELEINNYGLIPGANDEETIAAVGTLAVLVYRIADRGQTPADLALSRLAVCTGSLLASRFLGDGERIVREWLDARAEYLALQITAQR